MPTKRGDEKFQQTGKYLSSMCEKLENKHLSFNISNSKLKLLRGKSNLCYLPDCYQLQSRYRALELSCRNYNRGSWTTILNKRGSDAPPHSSTTSGPFRWSHPRAFFSIASGQVTFGKTKITMETSVWHFSFKSQGLVVWEPAFPEMGRERVEEDWICLRPMERERVEQTGWVN